MKLQYVIFEFAAHMDGSDGSRTSGPRPSWITPSIPHARRLLDPDKCNEMMKWCFGLHDNMDGNDQNCNDVLREFIGNEYGGPIGSREVGRAKPRSNEFLEARRRPPCKVGDMQPLDR